MGGATYRTLIAFCFVICGLVVVGIITTALEGRGSGVVETELQVNTQRSVNLASGLTAHQPAKANDFLNTLGIVTHLTKPSYTSVSFDGLLKPRLVESGIRHLRDTNASQDGSSSGNNIVGGTYSYSGQLKSLASVGISTTVSTYYQILNTNPSGCEGNGNSWDEIPIYTCDTQNRFVRKVKALLTGGSMNGTFMQGPNVIPAFTSLNEPDHVAGLTDGNWESNFNGAHPGWENLVVEYSHDLNTALNTDPTTANLPIIAPSFVHLKVFSASIRNTLSAILGYVDRGNAHIYCHQSPPASCIATQFTPWKDFFVGKTMVLTELGYHNVNGSGQNTATTEAATAKYILQAFPTYYQLGVERVFIYELKDQGGTDRETSFGLLRTDGSPKPAFTALKNFTAILADSSSNFQPTPLNLEITGALGSTHYLLLQKSNGEHYLLLWNEQGTDAVTVKVETGKELSQFYPLESATAQSATQTSTLDLNVSDSMMILKLATANSGGGTTSGGTTGGTGSGLKNNSRQQSQGEGRDEGNSRVAENSATDAQLSEEGALPAIVTKVSNLKAEVRVATAGGLLLLLTFLIVWAIHHWRIDHWISGHLLSRIRKKL